LSRLSPASDPALETTFPGDSVMSALMRAHDWASTPLGPTETWPETLKAPLRMMLTSKFEMWLGWGQDLHFFYNDAYLPTLGSKHPDALGRPTKEVWAEIYDSLTGRFDTVMRDGQATWDKALQLFLLRKGYAEETYHTFSYSPLMNASGAVEGLMCVVTEETERVISERRLALLHSLTAALLPCRTREALVRGVTDALDADGRVFPFSLVRFLDDDAGSAGDHGTVAKAAWPFDMVDGSSSVLVPLNGILDDPPCGAWPIPPREALITPITKAGQMTPAGALVLGLNPYRPEDPGIIAFAELIATQIAGALATVDAWLSEAAEMERLQQLFEQSPSFMAVLRGPEHRFELTNPEYLKLIGHRDVIGKTIREALPDIDGQGFYELLDKVYTSGEPFVGRSVQVFVQPTPDAAPGLHFLDFVYQPIRAPDGAVTGVFVEGIDVTTTHDALMALRASEAQFRTFAEAMPNHVWTSPPDGMLDWFNSQVYRYAGARPGDLDGLGWTDIIHPDDLSLASDRWTAALAAGESYEAEFRIRRADSVYRWHISRAAPIRAEDGSILRWIGSNTDIEDQKSTAEALAHLNATLETQVQERTAELMATEEALRQSQKMEAVGQLTGGIAHDFNNLLAGITGSLEMLQVRLDQGRLDATPRYIDAAQGAARRAAALTQRLLAFSRRQTLDPRPVNVNRLIGDMEDLIRRTVGPSVEIEVVGAGGVWPILVDPHQLENALLNLCINARDAMPDGGRITIETANKWLDDRAARDRELPPGQYVSLCVSDTGTGMPPEVVARAFDPFFTTKPLGAGTGLGLSMIYGFVRQSGGQVRIYSEVGQGTTMGLYLPRHAGEAEDDAAKDAPHASYDGHGETVLVVDDEEVIRMLITDVLEEAGYSVLEAADGGGGLKVLQSDARIDLLITDVGLPGGMNGRQLADAGRVLRPDLKVLFITGYAENAVIGHGHLEAGMQVITKPFAVEALGEKVRQMIDN
jgi:PAS domain S-box-containing protein